jgi:GNAT superfamily N-acetyltransferase
MTGPLAERLVVATLAERLVVATLAERPDLRAKIFGPEIQSAVPEFMRHDPNARLYYGDSEFDRVLDFVLAAVDPAEPDRPLARACCVPFAFGDGTEGRDTLPDRGWDEIIRWGYEDRRAGRRPNAVSALEIMVAPRLQAQGIARRMLMAMRDNVRRLGFADLYGPLRPTMKDKEPETPFAEYCARRRDDGLPWDPWVRLHVRAGATIVKPAPTSMVVAGTLAEWRGWTGLDFAKTGPMLVPGALSPVHVSVEQDHAVYVEPNLWVHHRVG